MLLCLRTGGDGSGDVAGTQSQPRRQSRQRRYQHRDHDFEDFFLSHNNLGLLGLIFYLIENALTLTKIKKIHAAQ